MKLAFVSPPGVNVLPPRQKSGGIWIYQVAKRLSRDHEVHVYASTDPQQKEVPGRQDAEYHFISMGIDRPILALLRRLGPLRGPTRPMFASPLYHIGYALKVARMVSRRDFDMIHITSFFQLPYVVRMLEPRTKIAIHMHCDWLTQLDRRAILPLVRKAALILGSSDYLTGNIRRAFPSMAPRCHTLHPGVDVDLFSPGPGGDAGDRMLFVGRISPEKGVHVLIEAMPAVLRDHPDASLQIVGPESSSPIEFIVAPSDDSAVRALSRFYSASPYHYYRELLRRVEELGIQDRVSFTPYVPQRELVDLYRGAAVLVNPSLYESFGLTPVEAMSCGRPVVASRVGGMVETVEDGRTGSLVPRNDPEALAAAVVRILSDPDMGGRMGSAGREMVLGRYSWDHVVEKLLLIAGAWVGKA